jgi:hypothetical protein
MMVYFSISDYRFKFECKKSKIKNEIKVISLLKCNIINIIRRQV